MIALANIGLAFALAILAVFSGFILFWIVAAITALAIAATNRRRRRGADHGRLHVAKVKRITLDVDTGRLFDACQTGGTEGAAHRALEMLFLCVGRSFGTEIALASIYGVNVVCVKDAPAPETLFPTE